MNVSWLIRSGTACGAVAMLCVALALAAEPETDPLANARSKAAAAKAEAAKAIDAKRVPVEVARDRATLMHDIYSSTLDVMHHRYFHGDRTVVPARAMEDIFSDINHQSKVEARWISVNMKPMSIDHEPATPFEKRAAKEIADGKTDLEVIEDGYYRRATAIPLTDGCVSCHQGFFRAPSKTPKFAGLVLSVPVLIEPKAAE